MRDKKERSFAKVLRSFVLKVILRSADPDVEKLIATGATHGVLAGNVFQAQIAFAMAAFTENVRFCYADAAARMRQIIEESAERHILPTAAYDVTRKTTEQRVSDKACGYQRGKRPLGEPLRDTADECERKRNVINGIGTVSSHHQTGEETAESASEKAHEDLLLLAWTFAPKTVIFRRVRSR